MTTLLTKITIYLALIGHTETPVNAQDYFNDDATNPIVLEVEYKNNNNNEKYDWLELITVVI